MERATIALMGLALALPGCAALGLSCTEVGCMASLSVMMQGSFLEGEAYEVVIEEMAEEPCVFTLPLQGDEGCVASDDEGRLVVTVYLPMGEAPEDVTLVLYEDGEEAARSVERPSYGDPYYPNGKACDGVGCVSGQVDFVLPGVT